MPALIIKVTEKCNAACRYCYVVHKQHTFGTMSADVLKAIFYKVDEYLKNNNKETMEIVWHGGEPLLAGLRFFEQALEFQNSLCKTTKSRINHSLQTNLTLLTKNHIEIFHKLGVRSIGTSIDPIPEIRGIGKKNKSDKYMKLFVHALRLLDKSGINWGVIYVITKKSLQYPLKLFFYLSNLVPSGVINLNPVLIFGEQKDDIAISPSEYSNFLGEIFPYWWKHRLRYPNIQPFKALVESIVEGSVTPGCMDFGVCDSEFQHINIETNGNASLSGFTPKPDANYGNIKDNTLQSIFYNNEIRQFEEKVDRKRANECVDCRLAPLCSPPGVKSYLLKSQWCESRLNFVDNYFLPITGVKYEPGYYC